MALRDVADAFTSFDYRWRQPDRLVSIEDYRRRAGRRVPKMAWTYVEGGADDLVTVTANQSAFRDWSLRPLVLTGVDKVDTSVTVAGTPLRSPIILGPTGFSGLSHWTGDLAAARAAEAWGTRYTLSSFGSYSVEELAEATDEDHFFQIYPRTGQISATLMKRAWAAGYRTLFMTVDVPAVGNREGERREGLGPPPTMTPGRLLDLAGHPGWVANLLRHQRIASATLVGEAGMKGALEAVEIQKEFTYSSIAWDDAAWIRDQWPGRLIVKGIQDPSDAVRAVEIGFDGVMVSNHGGRQLDRAPASIDLLPGIVSAVAGRAEILIDGGIRRGSDIVTALALGADAVIVARPYLYGLAVAGQQGVTGILDVLQSELERTMKLMGVASVSELSRAHLVRRSELV